MARRIINKDRIRQHLMTLERNGRLQLEDIVTDAKRDDSPIHEYFTWNVQEAAEAYWLLEAQTLVRSVVVRQRIDEIVIERPCYIEDPRKESRHEQGYSRIDSIRHDPVLVQRSLQAECERALSILRRARLIAVSLGHEEQVDMILSQLTQFNQQLSGGSDENHSTATQ